MIQVFQAEWCPYSKMLRQRLTELGVDYVDLDRLWAESDLISLNAPLSPETHHLVNEATIRRMKRGVMLVNTGRGPLIDTAAVVLAGRAFANMLRQRAQRLWLSVPDQDGPEPHMLHHRYILERADRDAESSKRWTALSKTLVVHPTP